MPETAAVTQSETPASGKTAAWARVQSLACDLTVELALPDIKVRDLMQIRPGWVIDSNWEVSADVPMRVNGVLIAWGEFEVAAGRLAVRMTELSDPAAE